jgi:hypothetical protein
MNCERYAGIWKRTAWPILTCYLSWHSPRITGKLVRISGNHAKNSNQELTEYSLVTAAPTCPRTWDASASVPKPLIDVH